MVAALAKAITPDKDGKGALASLKELTMDDGPLGVDHPKLKAVCQQRGIDLK